jgi:hypothetical protein
MRKDIKKGIKKGFKKGFKKGICNGAVPEDYFLRRGKSISGLWGVPAPFFVNMLDFRKAYYMITQFNCVSPINFILFF